MSSTAPISGATPEVSPTSQTPAVTPAGAGQSQTSPTQGDAQADLRLVIEDDKAAGSYVYVTINPVTGQVVSQVPREQLLKMREDPSYQPGSVVNSVS
jgi:flagellar protein FlaG